MVSFHGVEEIRISEPRSHSGAYTNEIIITADGKDYRFDLFADNKNKLRFIDEQFKTLRSIFRELAQPDPVTEN